MSQQFTSGYFCSADCLKEYVRDNHKAPKKVLVFRSGTSFGETETLRVTEIEQIYRVAKVGITALVIR